MNEQTSDQEQFQPGTVEHAAHQHFMGWQCRVRQYAMRYAIGRPSSGMMPEVFVPSRTTGKSATALSDDKQANSANANSLGPLIIVINKADSANYSKQFRHMVLKTQDPNERYDSALTFFSGTYYQQAHGFDGQLTALFGAESQTASELMTAGSCTLVFEEYRQRFELVCAVSRLQEHDLQFQSTYWHNRLFNPNMPAGVQIIGFSPDWAGMVADPPLGEQYRS